MSDQMIKTNFESRQETDGTWSVFDLRSGMPATQSLLPVCDLSEVRAKDLASAMNRVPLVSPSRLHRYAIQGLPPQLATSDQSRGRLS